MTFLRKAAAAAALTTCTMGAYAADYTDGDTHKNDYKWMQANLMYAFDELPGESSHDYLELEFGGRAGALDYYGYFDVFNLTNSDDSDKAGKSKTFMKFAPRLSLDAISGKDLSFGSVQEVYFATLFNWGGGYDQDSSDNPVNNSFWGIGSDVMVPWLGKVGLNFYALYNLNAKKWDGYQVSTNWFKPFHTFSDGSFLSYQGYIDYQWGVEKVYIPEAGQLTSSNGGAWYNGLYWHSKQYSLGYGLKLYKDVYALTDGGVAGKTSGVAHYIAATYKF